MIVYAGECLYYLQFTGSRALVNCLIMWPICVSAILDTMVLQ